MNRQTSQNIQSIAKTLFSISVIAAILLGILIWVILARFYGSGLGFLVCVLIIGLSIVLAYIYKILMIGFGEILDQHAEQTDMLRKITTHINNNTPNQTAKRPAQDDMTQSAHPAEASPHNTPAQANTPHAEKQTAVFESRSSKTIVCPICNKEQISIRNSCFNCGSKFIYLLELPLSKQTELRKKIKNQTGNHPYVLTANAAEAQPSQLQDVAPDNEATPELHAVEFESRSFGTIFCPKCGKRQSSHHDICDACGCKFIYKDEQPK